MKKPIILILLIIIILAACTRKTVSPKILQSPSATKPIQSMDSPVETSISMVDEKVLIISQENYYLAKPDGTEIVLLYPETQGALSTASLSPNGEEFAYYKDGFLYILTVKSKTTRSLNQEIIGSSGRALRWSPDGAKLAMNCANSQHPSNAICLIDTKSGQIEFLLDQNETNPFCESNYLEFLDWSRDGATMVYICFIVPEKGQKGVFALYLYDMVSKTSRQVFDSSSQDSIWYLYSAALSPRKYTLLISGAAQKPIGQVFLLDLSTNKLKQLTNDDEYHSIALAWRHDGGSFYLHTMLDESPYTESNYVMDMEGKILFPVAVDGTIIE